MAEQVAVSAREEGKDQRRRTIVDAARALLREAGGDFGMRELAVHAGVSVATPYNLFGSKQAILAAVFDADLAHFPKRAEAGSGDALRAVFDAIARTVEAMRADGAFYQATVAALGGEGGLALRRSIDGPRFRLWKQLLDDVRDQGFLTNGCDPNAFAVTASQLIAANLLDWGQGYLELEEADARMRFGLALCLRAFATPAALAALDAELAQAEADLQALWQRQLTARLKDDTLTPEDRAALASMIKRAERTAS